MWALSRASLRLRIQGLNAGASRASCVKLMPTTRVEDEAGIHESHQIKHGRFLSTSTFYHTGHASLKFTVSRLELSSQADAISTKEDGEEGKELNRQEISSASSSLRKCRMHGRALQLQLCYMQGLWPGTYFWSPYDLKASPLVGHLSFHSGPSLKCNDKVVEQLQDSEKSPSAGAGAGNAKVKKKKLKGKRAVVRWLKFFRWKKKKEHQRMTAEEKLLYKLTKAQKKEERLCEALKKIEPAESSETTHDPEILTPEEHFFFLKMGLKCKNYVPVGRRGIYQGVILNMHLHWKKHQTLKVVVKTFSPEEVKEIAIELARLTGGIVLDIHEDNTIIMYRGKNYSQPPTEIMSPRVTLSRKKALDKSKYRDGLRAVRRYIPRLEQELEILRAQLKSTAESNADATEGIQKSDKASIESDSISNFQLDNSDKLREMISDNIGCSEDETDLDSELDSYSDKLSDIFETDSDTENFVKEEKPLYLDEFNNFPELSDGETDDFEEHLRQISLNSKNMENDVSPKFDEVDKIFLRAASFLKKKRK